MERNRRTISAAVQYVVDEGDPAAGRPFRAILNGQATAADGATHSGPMLLVSARPYDVRPGDSVALAAAFRAAPDPTLPPLVVDDAPEPLHNRARALFAQARIVPHGRPAPGAARPAADALAAAGVSVVRRDARSPDPVIRWAAAILEGLAPDGSVAIVDPLAFTPPPPAADGTAAPPPLRAALPETLAAIADDVQGEAVGLVPMYWPLDPDRRALGATGDAVVVPYSPYTTGATDWQSLTGLSLADFAPRAPSAPGARRRFAAAHETAHALQEKYGIAVAVDDPRLSPERVAAATNLAESFADGFATMACWQEDRDLAPHLRACAKERWASLLTTDLGHATSAAINRMLTLCERLERHGLLDHVTPDRMARIAARNAHRTAMTAAAIDHLNEARAAILGGTLANHLRAQNGPPPAVPLEHSASCFALYEARVADPTTPISGWARGMLRKALESAAETAWTPRELAEPRARWAAARTYANDLARSAAVLRGRLDAIALLHDVETGVNAAAGGATPLQRARLRLVESSRTRAARAAAEAPAAAPAAVPVTMVRSRHDPAALREAFRRIDADPSPRKAIVLAGYCDQMRREITALDRAAADPAQLGQANRLRVQRAAVSLALQVDPDVFAAATSRLPPEHAALLAQGAAEGRIAYDAANAADRRVALAETYGALTGQRAPCPAAREDRPPPAAPAPRRSVAER